MQKDSEISNISAKPSKHHDSEALTNQESDVLVIDNVSVKDMGKYRCMAINDVNAVFSNWAEIKVQKEPICCTTGKCRV